MTADWPMVPRLSVSFSSAGGNTKFKPFGDCPLRAMRVSLVTVEGTAVMSIVVIKLLKLSFVKFVPVATIATGVDGAFEIESEVRLAGSLNVSAKPMKPPLRTIEAVWSAVMLTKLEMSFKMEFPSRERN